MPGEVPTGQFDVTKLEAIEIEQPGTEYPSNIIDFGENFKLRVTFQGQGTIWDNMSGLTYNAQFYAEGMGPGVPDQNLGNTQGAVTAANQYTVDSPVNNIITDGIYRCGVTVTFQKSDGTQYWGVLGYNEDCVIQISRFEEKF